MAVVTSTKAETSWGAPQVSPWLSAQRAEGPCRTVSGSAEGWNDAWVAAFMFNIECNDSYVAAFLLNLRGRRTE
ncbi:MAG: hypothetical protein QUS33_14630 [Dehalococcoidia bacterium]|nr:hypothetical protein [Dehalococcoidia bacterium]